MPTRISTKDLRDTASFLKLVESEAPKPVVVTKNGYDEFVVVPSEEYDRLCERAKAAQLYETLLASEIQLQKGKVAPLDPSFINEAISDAL